MVDQLSFYNDQDIFNSDFDYLYETFISSIDRIRSHYNGLANSKELNTPQYQESRCSAFFRRIGFPVVADGNNFHSPGFDPNLNTEKDARDNYKKIDDSIIENI